MPAQSTTNFANNSIDFANTYVTKAYAMQNYPNLFPQYIRSELHSWGTNQDGSAGNGTVSSTGTYTNLVLLPRGIVKQISIGTAITALTSNGVIWSWGTNTNGVLGDNTTSTRSSPVTVVGGKTWIQVSSGFNHTVALDANNVVWSWGLNTSSQLGDGTTSARSSPVRLIYRQVWPIKTVSAGPAMTAAIDLDGVLWTWGSNSLGQLGDNTITTRSSPVTVVGNNRWLSVIAAGAIGSNNAVAAIDANSRLWMWGSNQHGQLGDNTTTTRSSPVTVVTPTGATGLWSQVYTNGMNTSGIMNDGTLWSWGRGSLGVLGDGTQSLRSSPVQVFGGGTNWQRVYTNINLVNSQAFTMALKTNGSLWGWGQNSLGNFGIGVNLSTNTFLSPVRVGGNTNADSLGVPNPDYLWKILPTTGNVLSSFDAGLGHATMLAILDVEGY